MEELQARVALLIALVASEFFLISANLDRITGLFGFIPSIIPQPPSPVCGNGFCETGEDQSNCCSDCGCSSGQVCNITANTCYTSEVARKGIAISDAEVSGPNTDPKLIYVGNALSLSVKAEPGEFGISRVWIGIAEPSGNIKTIDLNKNKDKTWRGFYLVPAPGNYIARFNAIDEGGNLAEPIEANFSAMVLSQVGPFIPVGIPGY